MDVPKDADADIEQTPGAQIARLYLVVLGRQPDRAGLEAYVGHLQAGQSLEALAAIFVASEEFGASIADEPAPSVLYRNAHGTTPSPTWLAANSQAPEVLAAALVRDTVVTLRLPARPYLDEDLDPWALTTQVVRLYLVVLGRRPDPGGLAAHVEQRRAGMPLETMAAAFIASDEFRCHAGDESVAAVLHRNACGVVASAAWIDANDRPPEMAAVALVADPAVARRLSVLGALHPDGLPLDDADLYRRWLSELARPDAAEREAMRQDRSLPAVTWVMLLDNPAPEWLDAAISSVRSQDASGVELLLVSRARFCAVARRHARDDARVRLVRGLPWNRPAQLLGRALDACRGVFVSVIGQHDLLHETAAYEVAAAAMSADVVIGDEDAVDADGLRHSPRFGARLYPDALQAERRPGPAILRLSLVRAAGGPGDEPGASGECVLMSRIVAGLAPERLRHLPVLLRSRRDAPATTCRFGNLGSGSGRTTAIRGTMPGDVAPRVSPTPPVTAMVSIIVATRDRASLLRACLEGVLERTDYSALEVLVLDNGSCEEETLVLLSRLALDPRVRVLRSEGSFNWSALNNTGVREMRGDVAVLLNNDVEVVTSGWLRALVSHALRPDVGVVGAKLLYPDRTVQHAGMVLGPAGRATHMWRHSNGGTAGYMGQLAAVRDVTAVTGACMALRRAVYEKAGGLEEALPVTWSDVDLCLRMRELGLRVIWTPDALLLHHEQASRGTDETAQGQARLAREKEWMMRRWGEALDVDPFLSPNMLPSESRALLAPVPRRCMPWQKVGPTRDLASTSQRLVM